MNKKKSASAGIMSFCGEYSYILVFIAIFIVYAFTSSGLTWSGVMNVFRHSAVIGIIGIGMGLVCLTGEIDLSVGAMLALDGGFSVIIFNMTDSILLTFFIRNRVWCILRSGKRSDGRSGGNAGIYRNSGNYADVPFFCTVFLPAYG